MWYSGDTSTISPLSIEGFILLSIKCNPSPPCKPAFTTGRPVPSLRRRLSKPKATLDPPTRMILGDGVEESKACLSKTAAT